MHFAPSFLLMGDSGTGKTYSASTLARAGVQVNYLFTEPGMSTLNNLPEDLRSQVGAKEADDAGVAPIHYKYAPATAMTFEDMIETANVISTRTFEGLSQMKAGISKSKTQEFRTILECLSDYQPDTWPGKSFGGVDSWGPDQAIVFDSFTGLNHAARRLVVGTRPTMAPGEWGTAMNQESNIIMTLCYLCRCWVVCTAHLARERDEVTGSYDIFPSLLGQKLAPEVPSHFDEVVNTRRQEDKFYWSTLAKGMSLKARMLPLSDTIPPDFKPLVEKWRAGELPKTRAEEEAEAEKQLNDASGT